MQKKKKNEKEKQFPYTHSTISSVFFQIMQSSRLGRPVGLFPNSVSSKLLVAGKVMSTRKNVFNVHQRVGGES